MAKSWFPEPFKAPLRSPVAGEGSGPAALPPGPGKPAGSLWPDERRWSETVRRAVLTLLPGGVLAGFFLLLWMQERQTAQSLEAERAALAAETVHLSRERDRETAARRLAQAESRSAGILAGGSPEEPKLTAEIASLRRQLEENRALQEQSVQDVQDLRNRLWQQEQEALSRSSPLEPNSGAHENMAEAVNANPEAEAERRRSAQLEYNLELAQSELNERATYWERDLDSLRDHIVNLRDEVSVRDVQARHIVTVVQQEIQSAHYNMQTLENDARALERRLHDACAERDRLKSECSRLEHCLHKAEEENQRHCQKIHQLQCTVKELAAQLQQAIAAAQAAAGAGGKAG